MGGNGKHIGAAINGWTELIILEREELVSRRAVRVRRTWKDRLFSRPWRPWKKYRIEIIEAPKYQIYVVGPHTVICHPEIAKALRESL